MCSGAEWRVPESRGGGGGGGTKRRLPEMRERQVNAVCIGIEHYLVKRRRRSGRGGAVTKESASSALQGVDGNREARREEVEENIVITTCRDHDPPTPAVQQESHDDHLCQLCESTRRVLRFAQAHVSVAHDVHGCEACRMWSLVKARYVYLRCVRTATSAGMLESFGLVAAG